MAAIKLHVFRTQMGNPGTDACDFRGAGEHGAGENDQHRTVEEIDPASEELIADVLESGPTVNRLLQRLAANQPGHASNVATLLGLEGSGPVGLRIGVWDK